MKRPDGLIFDMDGTLWDNLDTYVKCWNIGLEKTGHDKKVTRDDLRDLMGKEARYMLNTILPEASQEEQNKLFKAVIDAYLSMQGRMTPRVFPGVLEGLEKLSKKYKLYLVSNCEEGGLVNFMNYTNTRSLFLDYAEHGRNFQPKSVNMQLLIERNGLQSPVYIGDTDSDSREAAKVGVPFVFVTYGFGTTDRYILKFDSFPELTDYFMNL